MDEAVVDVRSGREPAIDLRAPTPCEAEAWPSRRRILLVDDEPDVRAWLRIALEPQCWDVNAAADIPEAIEMAVRLEPDVVLLDQRLPSGNGLECGRWLRENRPTIVVLMFSAYLDLPAAEDAARLGIRTISKVDHRALFTTLGAIREDLDSRRVVR